MTDEQGLKMLEDIVTSQLEEQEVKALRMHFQKYTKQDIADELGVSRQWVYEILRTASKKMEKLQNGR